MVYRGKLSKACAECRTKKTRCDAARPTCGQCRRAKRVCSGYRDTTELRVLDQSFEVSSKITGRNSVVVRDSASRLSPSDSSSSEDSSEVGPYHTPRSSASSSSEDSWALSSILNFCTPVFWAECNARNVFFEQFIYVPGSHPKTDLGFVTPIYHNAGTNEMLESIMSALGIAVILKTHKDNSLRHLASKKYSLALKETQRALQDPRLAQSDETLATVLLLGLHELVATDSPETDLSRHSVHLQGSIRLLELRGHSQMDYNWGARMIHRITHQTTMSCLYSCTPVSETLLRFIRSVTYKMHKEEISGVQLLEMSARLCEVLSLPLSHLSSGDEVEAALQQLTSIEEDLAAWPSTLSWRFNIEHMPIPNPDKSFLTQQDSYLNHICGLTWNRWRSIRLRCTQEIVRLVSLDREHQDESRYEKYASIIRSMAREICQSVPFFLGADGTCWNWGDKISDPPTMFGASSMLMPLYFASWNPEIIGKGMHDWILAQIGRIADVGVAKAAQILDESREGDDRAASCC